MLQFYNTCLEISLFALVMIPVLLILNKFRFHSIKTTALYFLFAAYLACIYAVTGLPNITYLRFDPAIQAIPCLDMLSDFRNTVLNIFLFLPFGFIVSLFWRKYRHPGAVFIIGLALSAAIELLQMFTYRTTDVNDLITNSAGTILGHLLAMVACRLFPRLKFCHRDSDLPLLIFYTFLTMFLLQPVIWYILY